MLYAERDANGVIVAIRKITESSAREKERLSCTDLAEFLSGSEAMLPFENLLTHLDTGAIRILDDLIELLVQKNLILFKELPEEARQKLFERKSVRHKMHEEQLKEDNIL